MSKIIFLIIFIIALPCYATNYITSIQNSPFIKLDNSFPQTGSALSNNSGALVCYFNTRPSLNHVQYNKLNWIWGKIPPPAQPNPLPQFKSWWSSVKRWIFDSSVTDKIILDYKENILKYENDLIDTTYMISGTRLADGTIKTDKLSHQDLVTICKNSMVWRGVFGKNILNSNAYNPKIAQFLDYAESTKYYPSFPTLTEDFSRPIVTNEINNLKTIKSLYPTKFKNLVAFGDSLSDQGNIRRRMILLQNIGLFFPSEPYWGGRFTDYFNWLDEMHKNIGVSVFNWAFASAQTSNVVKGNIASSLLMQVDDYIKNRGEYTGVLSPYLYGGFGTKQDLKHTLFSIIIGGNNYINYVGYNFEKKQLNYQIHTSLLGPTQTVIDSEFVSHSILDIKLAIDKLIAAGAKYFIVGYLPDMSKVPEESIDEIMKSRGASKNDAIAIHKRLEIVIKHHNAQLKKLLTSQFKNKKVTFITVDLFNLVKNIQTHHMVLNTPLKTSQACYDNFMPVKKLLKNIGLAKFQNSIFSAESKNNLYMSNFYVKDPTSPLCPDPENYLFWDGLHPTSKVHTYIADSLTAYLKANFSR